MSRSLRHMFLAVAMTAALPLVAAAQSNTLMTDLSEDLAQVEKKMIDLARAMPADKFDWRPGAGVRSFSEVMMHVAADNYLFPAVVGTAAPEGTGIKGDDYKTAAAFEQRKMGRDAVIAELEKSFAHLKQTMSAVPASKMSEKVKMFGMEFTGQRTWIMATTHLHEHLGQAIAYARSNNVVPPWSK
jgi:uncharacterized damage-inducible protein DinB